MGLVDEELWQAYDMLGQPITGQGITKAQARVGLLHASSHVWVWRQGTEEPEILLQERAHDMLTWAGYYDVSAAGHVDLGETPLATALRETKEEISLELDKISLRLHFVYQQQQHDLSSGIIENEYQWVYSYLLHEEYDFSSSSEVASLKWVPVSDFRKLITIERAGKQMVPRESEYYEKLIREITRQES